MSEAWKAQQVSQEGRDSVAASQGRRASSLPDREGQVHEVPSVVSPTNS